MTYIPTTLPALARRVAQPISRQKPQNLCQDKFLIVCCGNELQGDDAVGPIVAMMISSWKLASVRAVVVDELTPALISELSKTNYVIFVEPCDRSNRARNAQLYPIVAQPLHSRDIYIEANQCSANVLLSLTQQVHNNCPQSWRIKVPTEDFRFAKRLSSTAQTGISQALKTITQFLRIYQSPASQSPASQSSISQSSRG